MCPIRVQLVCDRPMPADARRFRLAWAPDGFVLSHRRSIDELLADAVRTFVHHGTTIGEGSVLDADSFLMKGEQVPAGSTWRGNPAAPRRDAAPRAGAEVGTVPP